MSAPFVIAVPAKGRLQEHAEAFFSRAGLDLVKPRGAREYRGAIADLPGVEVAYLSAAEIAQLLAQGAVHFGVTGEDLIREMIPDADAKIVFIDRLGFGHANVVVAVPQAWIDVHGMADLDDVATAFRLKHDRKMRVATKYLNLTRDFFSAHGDHRLPDRGKRGRDRGRAGGRHRRVHRRHHDHRRDARRQRPEGDRGWRDPALAGQSGRRANSELGRSRTRDTRVPCSTASPRRRAPALSARCARTSPAATMRWWPRRNDASRSRRRSAGRPPRACSRCIARPQHVHALASLLRERGAENVAVFDLGYVFSRANPLHAKLEAGLRPHSSS